MEKFDWHYIGQFGQLGPLSEAQVRDLINDGVILAETHVWKSPMPQWQRATDTAEFMDLFARTAMPAIPSDPTIPPAIPHRAPQTFAVDPTMTMVPYSDRSRVVAGVLQIVLPLGIGRMYLGYVGMGITQLILTPCFGIGSLWSFIDGILMLCGSPQTDGMGRPLRQ